MSEHQPTFVTSCVREIVNHSEESEVAVAVSKVVSETEGAVREGAVSEGAVAEVEMKTEESSDSGTEKPVMAPKYKKCQVCEKE